MKTGYSHPENEIAALTPPIYTNQPNGLNKYYTCEDKV
jgi:hypothetical protein